MIPISEIEQNREKEVEERFKREITEEFKKKLGSRRKAGLIISGVGGILYLINGFIYLGIGFDYFKLISIPLFIAGAISLIGTIIGAINVKIGGVSILISIPISLFIAIILSFNVPYFYPTMVVTYSMLPFPLPLVGGILCLLSSYKREFTEDFKKKKLGSRRKIGLILSGIGGIMYLLNGIILPVTPMGLDYLIIGTLSLMGVILIKGLGKIKLGSVVILISIPISIVVTSSLMRHASSYFFIYVLSRFGFFLISLYPIPFPSSVLVIIGGILCLKSFDKESSEHEDSIKIAV